MLKYYLLIFVLILMAFVTTELQAYTEPYRVPTDTYIEIFHCDKLVYLLLVEENGQLTWTRMDPTFPHIARASLIGSSTYYRIKDPEECN